MDIPVFFDEQRIPLFWLALATTLVFLALMSARQGFRPPDSPSLVDLEIAADPARFHRILDSWGISEDGRLGLLRANVLLDFGFLAGYSLLLAAVAVNTAPGRVGSTAWLVVLALLIGLADAVENLALLQGLRLFQAQGATAGVLAVMAAASHTKWLLLGFVTLVLAARLASAFRSGLALPIGVLSGVFLLALALFLWKYFSGLPAALAVGG